MRLKGSIIKHKDNDTIGILIEHMEYNLTEDLFFGRVRYFSMFPSKIEDFEESTTVDTMFKCHKKDFIEQFKVLTNADMLSDETGFEYATWGSIDDMGGKSEK